MASTIPFDYSSSLSLLSPGSSPIFRSEEDQRPWRTLSFHTFNRPFLRLWDHYSGSQLTPDGRLSSRAPNQRLDTRDARKDSLTIHVDHKDWRPTPYISFTTSPAAIRDIADMRVLPRGPHTLTVVDPDLRLKKGLPVLNVAAEMGHYNIRDPYGRQGRFYKNHYVCLWEVSADEVVGHWRWDELACRANWYEEIVMPVFLQGRHSAVSERSSRTAFGLSTLAAALPDLHGPRGPAHGPSGHSEPPPSQTNDSPWSIIPSSEIYLEKLRLLCHSQQELHRHGYVTDQLSESQLESRLRCRQCRDRPKAARKRLAQHKSSLDTQNIVSSADSHAESEPAQTRQERRAVCRYHVGKISEKHFLCCGQHVTSPGCIQRPAHALEELTPQFRRAWEFHKTTGPASSALHPPSGQKSVTQAHRKFLVDQARRRSVKAIALDCEMGTAASGNSELIRITAIDFFTLERLVDRLVNPSVPMQHYNTRFSGVTAASMRTAVRQKTCLFGRDAAREELMRFVEPDTIVVVHGGNNDLSALRWSHACVIDTFVLEEYREKVVGGRSLKALCTGLLGVSVQQGKGHDSFEDAAACRELVHHWTLSIPD